ncbi:MAG TPA: ATP-binding protein, partial [Rhodopila sp.]|nr:ATP-binding protein [Rhodopila sp.]
MDTRLLRTAIAAETDIVLVRRRTRRLAELLGFDRQEQTRITTAVSEIVRNAFEYAGGGQVEFGVTTTRGRQQFIVTVRDQGPGIAELDAILAGVHRSSNGLGVGLVGVQRLLDEFRIDTAPGAGTVVHLGKYLPREAAPLTAKSVQRVVDALETDGPPDPMEEIRQQNQLILLQMQELRSRQEDLEKLNQELEDTNRGVVALYAELDERADHLRRADELKSRFLSHMSHEFRTPLNSILALSRLLLSRNDGDLTNEQDRQVRFIHKAAEDLTELVNDLLDLAKVEAGKTEVAASAFSVDSLFATLRGMLRPLLTGDAVALVFEDATSLPPLHTDEGKLSQILRNFISNAIKYTEHGEVRVWASTEAPHGDGFGSDHPGGAPDGNITFYVRD